MKYILFHLQNLKKYLFHSRTSEKKKLNKWLLTADKRFFAIR